MDFTAIKCLVPLVAASFLPFGLASAATGDSVVNAEALGSVTETVQAKSVRFVEAAGWIDPGGGSGWSYDEDEDDDWGGGSGGGWGDWDSEVVYFYRVSLIPGKDYTFWLDDRPDNWIDMSMSGYDESNGWGESTAPKTQIFDRGGGYFRVLAGEWDASDTAPADYIIEINGGSDHAANAYAGTLHYVQGAYDKDGEIRNGTRDRPTELGEITDTIQSRSFPANSVDQFHYVSCSLVAGRKYVFSVKSGTSANPASLELMADAWSGLSTNGAVYSVSGNNVTVTFAPGMDGTYLLRLSCERPTPDVSYELEYSVIRPLKPSEHGGIVTIGTLTPGVRTLCEPGDVVKSGSAYYDTVIDEQLFVFAAQAGHRYKVVTDSATAGIFGEIYDGDGNVLAASGDSLAPGDSNIQFGFAATSSADHYLGVALREGREGRLQPVEIGLTLTDITDVQPNNDAFDPADDAFAGATLLTPALVGREGVAPVNADPSVRDVHTLSETDWCDTFCVDCRKGQTYSFQIATVDGVRPAQGVRAGVCRLVGGIPVAVESKGILDADTARNVVLSFVPSEDGRHYLTLCSSVGNTVDYPLYKLHSTVCTAGDDWDEKDSERAGATTLAMGPTPATNAVHTLWAGDAADWYRFEATEGSFCSVKFVDRSGDAVMSLYDADGNGILGERTSVSFAVPATGTYFLKVSHPSGGLSMDGTYRLETMSVNVGTISFERTSVNATEDNGFVALKVQRTSGEGAVRIRWGTLSGTAKAGEDYFAVQEELALAVGETEGTLTVRLIPDLIAKAESDKVFYVRIEPVSADSLADSEYPIAVIGPETATVTLTDTGDAPSVEISLGGVSAVGNAESLSMGTFAGVLLEEDGYFQTNAVMSFAKVDSLVSAADGTYATVEIDGKSQMFIGAALADAGDGYAYGKLTSDDDKDILSVAVPTGMVASLATSVPHSAIAELRRQVPAAGGSTDEIHYFGRLFRTDNAKYTEIRKRLFDGATAQTDCYTAVLRSSDEGGDGYLAISVKTDGTVTGTGQTPDGRDFSFKSFAAAYLSESDAPATPSFGIPFVASSDDGFAIGGTMNVSLTFRGEGDIDRLLWVDDSRRDFFGRTFRVELEPVGGRFDGTLNLTAYFKDLDLVLSRDGSDVSITGNAMTGGRTERLDLTIDPLTGVASGTLGERICGGVIVQRSDESTAFDLDNVAFGGVAVGIGGAETVRVISTATSHDETETRWGFKSTVTFDGNGADDPAAVPQGETHFVGEAILLPQPAELKKDGFVFKGWRSATWGLVPPGGEYRIPAIGETLVADWQYSVEGFAEALDCQEIFIDDDFETGGASPWHIDREYVAKGVSCIRSGQIAATTDQWIRTRVPFSGELSFIWSCDIDNGGTVYAKYVFATNGIDVATIGAKTEWTTQTVDVVAGTVLTWTLSKTKDAYSYPQAEAGQDRVWLDGLRLGRKTTVTFLAEGGEPKSVWTTNVTGFAGQETLGDYLKAMPVAKWNTEMVSEWLSSTGGVVTLDWVFPDKDTELTPVVEPRTFTLTYDANGGENAPVDDHGYTNREEAVLLPPGDLHREGYLFNGWEIGGDPYDVGATYVFGADDATVVAQWTLDYASALGCSEANLSFTSAGELPWQIVSNDVDCCSLDWSPRILQSAWIVAPLDSGALAAAKRSDFSVTAKEAGKLTFSWRVSCDDEADTKYAWAAYVAKGVETRISSKSGTEWRTVSLDLEEGETVTWIYGKEKSSYCKPNPDAKEDRACLKDFVWVPAAPSTVSFTVNWTTDAGGYPLSEVGYVVDNVTNAPVSGEPFEVERGKTVRITATVAEWNVATGLGDYLADADTVVTISTAYIEQALADETKTATEVAEAYGITNPEFRGVTAAAKLMLVKAVTWATGHGLGVAEINRISFDGEGNPVTPEAEAYLLDVDPGDATELSEARAAFRFTAFAGTAASARIGVDMVGDGGDYGNGKVLIRAYADPACQRRIEEPENPISACFYRAYLVR